MRYAHRSFMAPACAEALVHSRRLCRGHVFRMTWPSEYDADEA